MQYTPRKALATGFAVAATYLAGCSTPENRFYSPTDGSAIPIGNYETPSNVKGLNLKSVNTRDTKPNWELISLGGVPWEVRPRSFATTNEPPFVLATADRGYLEVDFQNKKQEILPSTYMVLSRETLPGTNNTFASEYTIDSSSLKADVKNLDALLDGNDGILKTKSLVNFGLVAHKIMDESYIISEDGNSYLFMPVQGLKARANLENREITTRNPLNGFYRGTLISDQEFSAEQDDRRQALIKKPEVKPKPATDPTNNIPDLEVHSINPASIK